MISIMRDNVVITILITRVTTVWLPGISSISRNKKVSAPPDERFGTK